MDNLVSHKVPLAAAVSTKRRRRRSDAFCDDVGGCSQSWPQQLCSNGTSTGAAERVKLNLFVNTGTNHSVTQREGEALIGLCITERWQTATVGFSLSVDSAGCSDGCFSSICIRPPSEIVSSSPPEKTLTAESTTTPSYLTCFYLISSF